MITTGGESAVSVRVESAAADEGRAERGEVIAGHDVVIRGGLLTGIGRRRAFGEEVELPAAAHRRIGGEGGALHAGQLSHALQQCVREIDDLCRLDRTW